MMIIVTMIMMMPLLMMSRGIFNEIMRIAEDCRETVTIILAGYGSDIEQKLFAYNIGMHQTCAALQPTCRVITFVFDISWMPMLNFSTSHRDARSFSHHEIRRFHGG